jgi:hypothetical protein
VWTTAEQIRPRGLAINDARGPQSAGRPQRGAGQDRAPQGNDRFIAASNRHLLAFNDLSDIAARPAGALSRVTSGGSFAMRQLYTDADEALFEAAYLRFTDNTSVDWHE